MGWTPLGRYLNPFGGPEKSIAELRRKQNMGWGRVILDKWGAGNILAEQIAVMVVISCKIHIERFRNKTAVAKLVAIHLFRAKVPIGIKAREELQATGAGADIAGQEKISLDICGSTHRVSKRRPEGLFFRGSPEQANAWLQLKGTEIGPQ